MKEVAFLICIFSALIYSKAASITNDENWIHLEIDHTKPISIRKKIETAYENRHEEKCFDYRRVWYKNDCYYLGSKNLEICKDNEILGLVNPEKNQTRNKNLSLKFTCKELKCIPNKVWWPPTEECVPINESSQFCGSGGYLQHDVFGDGVCQCHESWGQSQEYGKCQKFYQRGLCARTEVFVFDPETQLGKCKTDLCYTYNEPAEKEEGKNNNETTTQKRKLYVPFGEENICVILGSSEICNDPNSLVTIDGQTHSPACISMVVYSPALNPLRCPGNTKSCDTPTHINSKSYISNKGDFDL